MIERIVIWVRLPNDQIRPLHIRKRTFDSVGGGSITLWRGTFRLPSGRLWTSAGNLGYVLSQVADRLQS